MLQVFTTDIMDDPLLSGGQQEQKIIQVFDLCHFMDVYGQAFKIINYKHQINIIEDDGVRKGIYFCDLLYNTDYFLDRWFYKQNNIEDIRSQFKIKELWFVIVVESFSTDDLIDSEWFVQENGVNNLYDKIFYFNFSQSIIKKLK
jgi:hypothetical protein